MKRLLFVIAAEIGGHTVQELAEKLTVEEVLCWAEFFKLREEAAKP